MLSPRVPADGTKEGEAWPAWSTVAIGSVQCGPGHPLLWIAGPCVIESHDLTLRIAETLRGLADRLGAAARSSRRRSTRPIARRASRFAARGLQEGLEDAGRRQAADRAAGHDRHSREPAGRRRSPRCATSCKCPAFLARQTDLILAAGETGRAVNVKKGQFMAPWDMKTRRHQDGGGRQPPAAADRTRHHVRLRTTRQRHAGASRGCRIWAVP